MCGLISRLLLVLAIFYVPLSEATITRLEYFQRLAQDDQFTTREAIIDRIQDRSAIHAILWDQVSGDVRLDTGGEASLRGDLVSSRVSPRMSDGSRCPNIVKQWFLWPWSHQYPDISEGIFTRRKSWLADLSPLFLNGDIPRKSPNWGLWAVHLLTHVDTINKIEFISDVFFKEEEWINTIKNPRWKDMIQAIFDQPHPAFALLMLIEMSDSPKISDRLIRHPSWQIWLTRILVPDAPYFEEFLYFLWKKNIFRKKGQGWILGYYVNSPKVDARKDAVIEAIRDKRDLELWKQWMLQLADDPEDVVQWLLAANLRLALKNDRAMGRTAEFKAVVEAIIQSNNEEMLGELRKMLSAPLYRDAFEAVTLKDWWKSLPILPEQNDDDLDRPDLLNSGIFGSRPCNDFLAGDGDQPEKK